MEDTDTNTMRPIADLFGGYQVPTVAKKKRTSERAELVRYFFEHAKAGWGGRGPLTPGFIGYKLAPLSVQDLYAFKSMCEDRSRNGYPWGKFFWGALKEQPWQQQASTLVGA